VWVLYGEPGASYVLQPIGEGSGAAPAADGTHLTLTNSSAVLGVATNDPALPQFRVSKE
jgi:hypothetical protein